MYIKAKIEYIEKQILYFESKNDYKTIKELLILKFFYQKVLEKEKVLHYILDLFPIEDYLELAPRAYSCLLRANISTIGKLTSMSYNDLFKIKNLGRKTINHIIYEMNRSGFELKEC